MWLCERRRVANGLDLPAIAKWVEEWSSKVPRSGQKKSVSAADSSSSIWIQIQIHLCNAGPQKPRFAYVTTIRIMKLVSNKLRYFGFSMHDHIGCAQMLVRIWLVSFNHVHKKVAELQVEFVPMISLAKKMVCVQNMYSFCSTLNGVEMNGVHSPSP